MDYSWPSQETNVTGTVSISGTVPVSFDEPIDVTIGNFPAQQHVIVDNPTTTVAISNFPSSQPVTGTFFQTVQPISASSLPLPTGASTSGLQTAGNTSLSSIDSKLTNPLPISGTVTTTPSGTQTITGSVSISNFPASQAVTAASLPLPSGASTSSLQTTGNTSLASIDSKLTNPLPVSGTFFQATQPVSIAASVSVTGPLTDTQLRASSVPVSGPLTDIQLRATPVPISGTITSTPSGTQTVTGTVTANLGTIAGVATETTLSALNTKVPSNLTVTSTRLLVDPSGVTSPISAVSLPLPSGASTSSKQPALGTAGTASLDVITIQGIASMTALKVDGSAITQPVSGTFFQATQPVSIAATVAVSGPLTDTQLRATPVPISGTVTSTPSGTQTVTGTVTATQSGTWNITNISGTVSLPTGASTETTLSTLNGKVPPNLTVTSTRLLVDPSGVTSPISAVSLPLPSGAATSANQSTMITSLSNIDAGTPAALGQTTMSASMPVVLPSDQSAIPIKADTIASYASGFNNLSLAASTTVFACLVGSNTKTIKLTKVTISCLATTAITANLMMKRLNVANTQAPLAAIIMPMDSAFSAGTATFGNYTTNPTENQPGILILRTQKLYFPLTTTAGTPLIWEFGGINQQSCPVLRGTSEILNFSLGGTTTVAGSSLTMSVEWTES